ncbi:glycosyltransferase [Salinimonas sediminis]|uniref:Glycosyltransferase n=1 Tax=Salinimonas sediminis TaxID=2303538 RepID=A0A346NJ27_9ALTE|nr:glycosyltransferase [Salinimonas sediminis]AXR05534.1 glycosyltransferase [Salinimonas sediminis]
MQQTTNVAFMINSLEGGGAERVMCKLLAIMEAYFKEQQLSVYLILLDDLPEAHRCPDYVNKITLDTQGSLVKGYQLAKQKLDAINPQFCISFLTRSNMLNVAIARQVGFQAILSERVNTSSHFSGGLKDTISKWMVKMSYPRAQRVIAVSEGVRADLIANFNVAPDHLDVIYNPYDIAQIERLAAEPVTDLPAKPFIIGTGRLVKNKNFSLLLEALAQSTLTDDLLILGQGDQLTALKAQAAALGIADRVHFAGFRENPYPYLKHARFFVSTSNAEGFPNAIVEAMCLGKAVIATNCESGPAEILSGQYPLQVSGFTEQPYGCLCETNHVEGVAAALNHLDNADQLARYSAQSALRAQDFSNAIFREKIIQVINPAAGQYKESHYVPAG